MDKKEQLSSFFLKKNMESLNMEKFKNLGISVPLLKSINHEKFDCPTEIQEKSIPLILAGKDIIAGSATGSGKTLAFGCGILQNAEKGKGIQALILTPTRELAEQVASAITKFSKFSPLKIIAVYGGVGINEQIRDLKTADVVVGTPGRMLDHIERKTIKLNKVETLVLDEADRMLDMGFKDDVTKIINTCPKNRQTLLFSATISKEIVKLGRQYMVEPIHINVESNIDASQLDQSYYKIQDNMKFSLLLHLLKNEKSNLSMVFCNTKRYTDTIAKNLRFSGIDAQAIHGGLTQNQRNNVMKRFHAGKAGVLVCTDVAARGLDVNGVSHVYNYDIPRESKQYIHRIGRTARAGKEGKAINILSGKDNDNFNNVLKFNDVVIRKEKVPALEKAEMKRSVQAGIKHNDKRISRKGPNSNRHRNR
ncbi:MAG: DEAD/DEAH box helicase [ANME-2 cluster archaeon]|nr:DEAD/DEAH box helicase [ANME-2 cluster archaeon]